jgi:hypothetical protein
MKLIEIIPPPYLAHCRAYVTDSGCRIFVGVENGRWHLSISHPERYPTWDEIKTARYQLVPNDVTMAMLLPPKERYVNIHPNCFHLWEIREVFPT